MFPRLDMRHLQMLVAIADTGSVTRAAALLGVTQSALSHRLREAERRLDAALFSRVNKRLRMTPAAERLYGVAMRTLVGLEHSEAEVERSTRGVRHVARLGIGAYTRCHWLPEFLALVGETMPEVEVNVIADAMQRPFEMLTEGAVDVVVMVGDPSGPGLRVIPMFDDELIAIVAPDHRLAERSYIVADDLVEETYITYSWTHVPGHAYDRLMRPANLFPRRSMRVELPDAIVELVRAKFGISILTRWAVARDIADGRLVGLPITDQGITIAWSAVVRDADGAGSTSHRLAAALAHWSGLDADAGGPTAQ